MENYLGRIVILVEDYEEAAVFYEKNFGFKRIFDATTDAGQRFLHVGTDTAGALGIWFLKTEGKLQAERVGNQTSGPPAMVIYTTSVEELYRQLKENKVRIKIEPVYTPEYRFFHCCDLYGNEIVVVEIKG